MKIKALISALILTVALSSITYARETIQLNSGWRVFSALDDSGDNAQSISLPHCWNQTAYSTNTTANYLRSINVPDEWRAKRVFIKMYGVQSIADLFVNGRHVGEHRGGATAFTFEITNFLKFSEENTLSLRVNSAPQNDILPTSIEHEIYGGIYRDVELIVTEQSAISPIFYGSDGVFVSTTSFNEEDNSISGEVEVRFTTSLKREVGLDISIVDRYGIQRYHNSVNSITIDGDNSSFSIPFTVYGVELWSPENPVLNRVDVTLTPAIDAKEREKSKKQTRYEVAEVEAMEDIEATYIDKVSITTGFRVVSTANDGSVKGALMINGKPTLLRGISLYHNNVASGGVLTKETYDRDISTVEELGANAIRSAIYPHDRYLYEECDRRGIVTWVDTPLSKSPFFSDIAYFPTARFEENGMQQLQEIIYQNYNHPSVIMWGLFSMLSTRGDDVTNYVNRLNNRAKQIDNTRPTVAISNQNGDINEIPDLIVWRQNIGWDRGQFSDINVWRDQLQDKWSHFRSGVMYGEGGSTAHQINRRDIANIRENRRVEWYPESRQSAMHETYTKELSQDSLFWGTWLPTLYDFKSPRHKVGENNEGLMSSDRAERKDIFYLYRALWNAETPTLHIVDRRANLLVDSPATLRVYSSDTIAPIAHIGDQEVEMKRIAPAQFRLDSIEVKGATKIVVKCGELSDSVELISNSPLRERLR